MRKRGNAILGTALLGLLALSILGSAREAQAANRINIQLTILVQEPAVETPPGSGIFKTTLRKLRVTNQGLVMLLAMNHPAYAGAAQLTISDLGELQLADASGAIITTISASHLEWDADLTTQNGIYDSGTNLGKYKVLGPMMLDINITPSFSIFLEGGLRANFLRDYDTMDNSYSWTGTVYGVGIWSASPAHASGKITARYGPF